MADVIAGKKIVRRPVRFEDWRIQPLFSQFVFIGVNQVRIPMFLEPFNVLKKSVRFENIVVIQETDPFAAGPFKTPVGRGGNAAAFVAFCEYDP